MLHRLWQEAGLQQVETLVIEVSRTYGDLDDFWEALRHGPRFSAYLAAMEPAQQQRFRGELLQRMPAQPDGSLRASGRAHAVRGRVPAS